MKKLLSRGLIVCSFCLRITIGRRSSSSLVASMFIVLILIWTNSDLVGRGGSTVSMVAKTRRSSSWLWRSAVIANNHRDVAGSIPALRTFFCPAVRIRGPIIIIYTRKGMEDWEKENAKCYFVDNNNGKHFADLKSANGMLNLFPWFRFVLPPR